MKKCLLIVLLIGISGLCFSQHPRKARKAYEKAQTAFAQRDYGKALDNVQKAVKIAPDFAEAWLLQGEIGMETHDFALAVEGYEQSLKADSMLFPPCALTLARLYDQEMRYGEAIPLLEWFQKTAPGNQANDEKAATMLANARFRENAVTHPVDFSPVSLGTEINTASDEYVNALELTGTELLFTRRFAVEGAAIQQEGLFVAHAAEGQWFPATQLQVHPDMDNQMGAAFLSYKGDELFFTVCGMDRHNQGCDLYRAVKETANDTWSIPQKLGETVNDPAWDSQPCLSLDGRELFFASRRGGNADLYHCYRNDDGSWSEPQSLDPVINTKGSEMAPFIHPDGKTLYFSSDTHTGMGGYDLFVSRRNEKGEWSTPVNLGYPINTPGDEINFIVAADGHTALISSIREGGHGGYDIYTFQLKEEELQPEPVNVYDFLADDLAPGAVVQLVNIQFEFNSAALTEASEEGVKMLAEFLRNHSGISVELAGHTDNVGSDTYNQKLSEERAEVVRQALIGAGIKEERLTAKGYGSSQPLYPNDTEEHRALNRRTEMVVTQILMHFSVLGDSYSTFNGFVMPETNDVWKYYDTTGVTDVRQTWWYQVAQGMGWILERNNSFSGSLVCNMNHNDYYGPHSFLRRMDDLGTPDVILVFGGTNDMWDEAPMGEYIYENWTEQDLCTFKPALACLFDGLLRLYPKAKVYFMADSALGEEFMEAVHMIAGHYGIACVDLANINKTWAHPDVKGMASIAQQVLDALRVGD